MKPVRLGVIGCGTIAQYHLRGAKESPMIDVVALADIREEAVRETAKAFNVATTYDSAEKLLDDERVEAVLLCTWAAPRTKIALKAFAKGKHVLTEKPVAMNAREVKKLLAARGKLVAGCCSSRTRFLDSAQAAAKLIASGALGKVRVLQSRCLWADSGAPKEPAPFWRLNKKVNGGGILMNVGCYDFDYLMGLCGWTLKPQTVFAQTWKIAPQFASHPARGSDAETHVAAMVRCKGGEVISFERGEYCAAMAEEAWRIVGTKGSLRLSMWPGNGKKLYHDEGTPDKGVITRTLWEGDEAWETVNYSPVKDFAAAIRERRSPRTSLEQALVVQQIADAIYASAARGKPVTIK